MDVMSEYKRWCTDPFFDGETRLEAASVKDGGEIEDGFGKSLVFGTGGLRGKMGPGPNRMNIYTVGKATQGLAQFINSLTKEGSVVVAYDSRKLSRRFAMHTACVLAANGIKALIFTDLRPTPELSFAVRLHGATAGVVITASHNPPEYNGYKVYWSDGGQIVPPYDKLIIDSVNAVRDYTCVKTVLYEEAKSAGLIVELGPDTDERYIRAVRELSLRPGAIKENAGKLKIVYTPLNGTGNMPVRKVLEEMGFAVTAVEEQCPPDGNFSTLKTPNPEDPSAFEMALSLAGRIGADIVLATDPDADRIGLYARDGGGYMPFTGNMTGILLAEYILSSLKEQGKLPKPASLGAVVSTIVSSDMIFPVAAEYGVTVIRTLTGFKYIGEKIKQFEEDKTHKFLFGFEESYGCLTGTHARDKDGVAAAAMICEAACYYAGLGKTLPEVMRELYKKYGYYAEAQRSIMAVGPSGAAKAEAVCAKFRASRPAEIGGIRVEAYADLKEGVVRYSDGGRRKTVLPASNVLYYVLEKGGWCCVRPSGTEPKIKFYFGARGNSLKDAEEALKRIAEGMINFAAI